MKEDYKYNFCIQCGGTCQHCTKAKVVSYDYEEGTNCPINFQYECEHYPGVHLSLVTCSSFKCKNPGRYGKCSSCKHGIEKYVNSYYRDVEEDYRA